LGCKWVVVELRKSFTNYDPNKHRSCNWVVSHLRITAFYDLLRPNKQPIATNEHSSRWSTKIMTSSTSVCGFDYWNYVSKISRKTRSQGRSFKFVWGPKRGLFEAILNPKREPFKFVWSSKDCLSLFQIPKKDNLSLFRLVFFSSPPTLTI